MGLTFLNVNTGERRQASDLGTALTLVQSRPAWTIVDTGASPYAAGWEILLMQAPMTGTYPNVVYDLARFDPDNTIFYVQRLGQQFTLRNLLAWSTTTTHAAGASTLFPPAIASADQPDPPNPPYCDPGPCGPPPPPAPPARTSWATVGIAAVVLLLLTEKK